MCISMRRRLPRRTICHWLSLFGLVSLISVFSPVLSRAQDERDRGFGRGEERRQDDGRGDHGRSSHGIGRGIGFGLGVIGTISRENEAGEGGKRAVRKSGRSTTEKRRHAKKPEEPESHKPTPTPPGGPTTTTTEKQPSDGPPTGQPALPGAGTTQGSPSTPPTTTGEGKPPAESSGGTGTQPSQQAVTNPATLCGPDVTELVFAVLREIKKDYDGLGPAAQAKACNTVTDLSHPKNGINGWDMHGLSPSTSPEKGEEFDPKTNDWVRKKNGTHFNPWLTGITNRCAIPKPQCAATVEFLGTCQHPQIVNYVQWGFMGRLCGMQDKFRHMMSLYEGAKFLTSLGGSQDTIDPEQTMNAVGDTYEGNLQKKQDEKDPDPVDLEPLKKFVKMRSKLSTRPEANCALSCPLTTQEQATLKATINGYQWKGMPGHDF
jgi:hypothetical protein